MKTTIRSTAFNGLSMQSEIELFVDSFCLNQEKSKELTLLSVKTISDAQRRICDFLQELYPSLEINNVGFTVISRDLEKMKALKITPDSSMLSEAVFSAVKEYIASELGFSASDRNILSDLKSNVSKFRNRFFPTDEAQSLHPSILRVQTLFRDKKYPEAFTLVNSIDRNQLSESDKCETNFLLFALRLKMENSDSSVIDGLFNQMISDISAKPSVIKRYYFEYIRFLENVRDFHKPRALIRRFLEKYPMSILNPQEKTIMYYLKGRAEYARGEYILALDNLTSALVANDPNDQEMVAAVYNTSVNPFTDNLFFEEALWIAEKAKATRLMLDLPETIETISCIAGIETKRGNHQEAYGMLLDAKKKSASISLTNVELNRLYNYLAKSAIFCQKFSESSEYLEIAEKAGDNKGFSKTIKLLLLLNQKYYDQMKELFTTTLMLPENHDDNTGYDKFALGWGYAIMAQAAFEQQNYRDGLLYLIGSLDWFIQDMYYLEARIVSLYGFMYELPGNFLSILSDEIRERNVLGLFEEYVEKHSLLISKYYKIYNPNCKQQEQPGNLELLAASIRDVDASNYRSDELRDIFDHYCFI